MWYPSFVSSGVPPSIPEVPYLRRDPSQTSPVSRCIF